MSSILGQLVVDETGLTGIFDMHLDWAVAPSAPAAAALTGPSLVATVSRAIREQLGLVLSPRAGLVTVFVVDHAERPVDPPSFVAR